MIVSLTGGQLLHFCTVQFCDNVTSEGGQTWDLPCVCATPQQGKGQGRGQGQCLDSNQSADFSGGQDIHTVSTDDLTAGYTHRPPQCKFISVLVF